MNIYVDGPITNSDSDLCPCGDFNAYLDAEFLFETAPAGECIQLDTQITSGYLAVSYPVDFSTPPLYVIGASYDAGNSVSSVCNMVKIDRLRFYDNLAFRARRRRSAGCLCSAGALQSEDLRVVTRRSHAQATNIFYFLSRLINSIGYPAIMLQPKGFCYFSQTTISRMLSQIHCHLSRPILSTSPFLCLVYLSFRDTIVIANHYYNPDREGKVWYTVSPLKPAIKTL